MQMHTQLIRNIHWTRHKWWSRHRKANVHVVNFIAKLLEKLLKDFYVNTCDNFIYSFSIFFLVIDDYKFIGDRLNCDCYLIFELYTL